MTLDKFREVEGGLVIEGFVVSILKLILDLTGSQWSSWRTGVMWSLDLVLVSRRAAEF